MTQKEFATFAMALKTYYPRETLMPNEQAMKLWFSQLQDIPYDLAEIALNKWVATNKWSPSIADLRESVANIKMGYIPDWGEAWEQVLHAISHYGYYQQAEALESMDELTRYCVKRIGFSNICRTENIAVDRANFRMIYEQMIDRKRMGAQLPESLIKAIAEKQEQPIGIANNDFEQRKYDYEEMEDYFIREVAAMAKEGGNHGE